MILAKVPNFTIQIGRDNKLGEYLSGKTAPTGRLFSVGRRSDDFGAIAVDDRLIVIIRSCSYKLEYCNRTKFTPFCRRSRQRHAQFDRQC